MGYSKLINASSLTRINEDTVEKTISHLYTNIKK